MLTEVFSTVGYPADINDCLETVLYISNNLASFFNSNKFGSIYYFFKFCMCMCVCLHESMGTDYEGTSRGQKRAPKRELELQMLVSHLM